MRREAKVWLVQTLQALGALPLLCPPPTLQGLKVLLKPHPLQEAFPE